MFIESHCCVVDLVSGESCQSAAFSVSDRCNDRTHVARTVGSRETAPSGGIPAGQGILLASHLLRCETSRFVLSCVLFVGCLVAAG